MRTLASLALLIGAVLVAFMAGCAGHPAPGSTPAYANTWTLVTLDGAEIDSYLNPGERKPSLTIAADGHITGYTGMNTLTTFVDPSLLSNGNFKFGNAMTTGRTGTPQQTIVESAFLTDLSKADYFTIDGGLLTFSKGDLKMLMFAAGQK
jgi:heat shock protein HslJ